MQVDWHEVSRAIPRARQTKIGPEGVLELGAAVGDLLLQPCRHVTADNIRDAIGPARKRRLWIKETKKMRWPN
jgi:hypothetical protein